MKMKDVKIGTLVAVSDADDATVWTITDTDRDNHGVQIAFRDKRRGLVSKDWIDISYLMLATKAQLTHYYNS